MRYLCLIYQDEARWERMAQADIDEVHAEYFGFRDEVKRSGRYVGGSRLRPTSTATTVRIRGGRLSTTDGPFAETREQLGGYLLIDARDLDEAIEIAARIPVARFGSIEVRPIVEAPETAIRC